MFSAGGALDVLVIGNGATAWCAAVALAFDGVRTVLAVPGAHPLFTDVPADERQTVTVLRRWGVLPPARPEQWGQALLATALDTSRCEVWCGATPLDGAGDAPSAHGPAVVTLADGDRTWRAAARVVVNAGPEPGRGSLDHAVRRAVDLAATARSLLCGIGPPAP